MIDDYGDGSFYIACDFCSNEVDINADTFLDAVKYLKKHGWIVLKEKGEWLHQCPVCASDKLNRNHVV